MFPVGPIGVGEGEPGFSYSGVYVAAERERVLDALVGLRFSGYLGPQEGAWVLAISGNPLGKVARKKRRIDDVARDLAESLGVVTLAAEVDRDSRLRLWAFDGEDAMPAYDSDPNHDEPGGLTLDAFGNPVMAEGAFMDNEMVAAGLLSTFRVEDEDGALVELLDEDLGEDTSESERLTGVLRLLNLPTWIVASNSLPRRVPDGPDKDEVTRLGAGRTGVQAVLADALTRPARPRPKRDL